MVSAMSCAQGPFHAFLSIEHALHVGTARRRQRKRDERMDASPRRNLLELLKLGVCIETRFVFVLRCVHVVIAQLKPTVTV